ncbi:5,10-methylenetetrahydrofolate reductase [Candidatus Aerophobetes bacterium Ae_b3b]|nr:MAG: 5,10-methylenetetrahydrofolate reductase [Candidatus Aerophobetes bacterium Ae_b3b]
MSFSDVLKSGKFLITTDVIPPKGINISKMLSRIDSLVGKVDAVNVVDLPSSVMRVSPLPIALLLKERRLEPILQMTCRDRNRLALQADLLGGYIMGITNILALTGDEIHLSDDPEAKPVFDLDSIELLKAARKLEKGYDLGGNPLRGLPKFCVGAVVDPGANPIEPEIEKMQRKVEAGAEFFQTQPIFDVTVLVEFLEKAGEVEVPILGGVLLLKSAKMARFMNEKVPGVRIPEHFIHQMEKTQDPVQTAIKITSSIINQIKGTCRGVHIMTLNWEDKVPAVLKAASF